MVLVQEMLGIGGEVSPVNIDSHNNRPQDGNSECEDADNQIEDWAWEVCELEHTGPHNRKVLIPPYLIEEGHWASGDASEKSDEFVGGVAKSLNAQEQFKNYEPADEDGVDDKNGIDRTKEVYIHVKLPEDIIWADDRLQTEEILLNWVGCEIVEVFHALGLRERNFNSRRKQPAGDVYVVEYQTHHLRKFLEKDSNSQANCHDHGD